MCIDKVALRMSKPAARRSALDQLPAFGRSWNDEATRLVCASLGLAIAFVVLRVVNVWS
jgi:hypothetical protein